jgi:NitT/TauT family transport system substrate-binding protein
MRRRFVVVLVALWVAGGGSARAAEPLVLQLKWLTQTQFAGYYVAAAKGFYRDAGLAVTIKPGGPKLDPSEELAAARADVAVNWMASALAERERGNRLVNIAQIFDRSGMMLTCRRDSGVRRPEDLKGKTVGVWFAGNQYPFLAWMAKLGFSTEGVGPDLHVLKQGAGVGPLVERGAACISTMSYNEYWRVLDAGFKPADLTLFRYEDLGVATLEDGLYTTEAKLADPAMRDRLSRFVHASVQGWQYTLAHPQEAVDIVLRVGSNRPLEVRHQARMLGEIDKLIGGNARGIGYLEPAAYERTVDVLLSARIDPVIRSKPQGAWTHDIWDKAAGD